MTIEFSKISNKIFDKKDMCVYIWEDDDNAPILDIIEQHSEDNQCSTARYKIEETSYKNYEFTLVKNWSDRDLPEVINGETEFRQMINKF